MRKHTAIALTAASLLAAVPWADAHAYYIGSYGTPNSGYTSYPSRYGGGVNGASQGPSHYTRGYNAYGGTGYVGIDTSTNISRRHTSDYYAREYALERIRAARVQAPCGQYMRKPLGCKFHTLSYRQYEAMNR